MASISSTSFQCFSSSASLPPSLPPVTRVRFQKPRPISAVCASTPVAGRSTASLYDVLGVQSWATCEEVKAAYRRLARVLHPDVGSANGQNDTSTDDFIRVHEAYATLSDPSKRADYDRDLVIRRRLEGNPSAPRFTRRSWETDQCW